IAALHARSWQENYRRDLPGDYLDKESASERLSVWTERFSDPNEDMRVMLAERDNELVGFCCLFLHHDPKDGTLLDNLHIHRDFQGFGIGRRLIRWAAVTTVAEDPEGRLYLWVLKNNTAAAEMYQHIGGRMGRTEQKQLLPDRPVKVEAVAVHFAAAELI
ncbi:MAG: GNAT family N-acetyltransferase, partial [Lewinella sp.]